MLNVVLFDDEKLALKMMEIQLKQIGRTQIIGQFTEYNDLIECIRKNKPNIAFLDIEIPYKNGLEAAQDIMDISPDTEIVFVTAYKDYAFDAYELEAQDYLLKPVKKARLERVIAKIEAIKHHSLNLVNNDISKKTKPLKIQMMSKFKAIDENGTVIKWRTKKTEELMVILIHHHNKILTSDEIIEALWPDKELEKAKKMLYTTMYYLKKILIPLGVSSIENQYSINDKDFDGDFIELKGLMEKLGEEIPDKWQDDHEKNFEKIQMLYQGGYLEMNGYEWAEVHKIEFERKFIALTHRARNYYHDKQDVEKEILILEQILKIDEYQEYLYPELLKLYQKTGNIKGYEKTNEKYKEIIKDIKF